jgi:glycosyltransferase involved in cell wall biosynthesis
MQQLITVILPTYNCEKFINECIDSILTQTYPNFELLIIDDCSTDNTVNLIKQYKDERIKLTVKEKNTGYTDSLNWGIENANGEYIARMDGDDVCLPTRFEEQVKVMIENPKVSICGSWAKVLGTDGYIKVPETNEQVFKRFLFQNAIVHPSLMFRKEVFSNYKYERDFEPAEDFYLWTKLIFDYDFYNIQKPLLLYRKHETNVSKRREKQQKEKALEAMFNFYGKISKNAEILDFKTFLAYNSNFNLIDFLKIYKLYKGLSNYKNINIKKDVYKLMKIEVHKLLINTPLKKSYKVFLNLWLLDKLRFIKYYLKNGI